MEPQITCYGGVAEIGGNKILVEDGEKRFLFDFGTPFGRVGDYFNELLRPRTSRGLLDLLALGLIPPLEGIYRSDLALTGLWENLHRNPLYRSLRRTRSGQAIDAVFISHAHLDHNADVSYLDQDIPVLTSRVSAMIMRTMQRTGQSTFEREMVWINPRHEKDGLLVSAGQGVIPMRPFYFVDGGLSPQAADFWVEPVNKKKQLQIHEGSASEASLLGFPFKGWPVDHSIPGAYGYALHTSAGWVAYTGDMRFHGANGAQTWHFADELAKMHPVALLCEGTHTENTRPVTESEVQENALSLMKKAHGKLVITDFGPRNVERLKTFLDLAKITHRRLALQPKDIYLLQAIALADEAVFPSPEGIPEVCVYADPKAAPRDWEKDLRARWAGRTVFPNDVISNPGDYILAWSLWDLNDLVDLQGIQGGVFLFSNSKAYDDEQKADLERLRNWVKWIGLELQGDPDDRNSLPLHSSGHASGVELVQFVKIVQPKTLIPIHTEKPDWWNDALAGTGIRIEHPESGKRIIIKT